MKFIDQAKQAIRYDCIGKIDKLSATVRDGMKDSRYSGLTKEQRADAKALKKTLSSLFLQVSNSSVTDQEVVEVDNSIEQIYVIYKSTIDTLSSFKKS